MKYLRSEKIDDFASIIESSFVGTMSPEEVLVTLDKRGLESYVTEEGALYIKTWQLGAENFVPPRHAMAIRSSRQAPDESNKLDWLSRNLQDVREEFGGKWVAVHCNEIVAFAPNLPDLMHQVASIDNPLVTFIPEEPVVWNFTYAV